MWKLAEDTLCAEELDALASWLRSRPRLTQGEQVARFEQAWSEWLGAKNSVFVNSGSSANLAAIAIAGRRSRRSPPTVGVAAVTWSTNVTPSLLLGHKLVVFDVNRRTLGIDSEQVCRALDSGELDILFVTHLLGLNALDQAMLDAVERNGVILLEDCCEAHGARFAGRALGTYGLASTFSFFYGHQMSTIEGGMVSTNHEDVADELRLFRAHGLARESHRAVEHEEAHHDLDPRFLTICAGLNMRATEMHAFLGLGQLPGLRARIEQRNANMQRFLACAPSYLWRDYETKGMSSFALPLIGQGAQQARRARATVDALGIESRPVVMGNILRQPFLREYRDQIDAKPTPTADHIHAHGLYVGNGHHVTEAMVEHLAASLEGPEG